MPHTTTSTITTTASIQTIYYPVSTDTIVIIDATQSVPTTVESITIISTVSTYVITETETSTIISESTDVVPSTSDVTIVLTDATETFYYVAATDTVTTTVATTTTTSISTTSVTSTSVKVATETYDLVYGPLPTNCFADYTDNGAQENWFYNYEIDYAGGLEPLSTTEDQAIIDCAQDCDGYSMSHFFPILHCCTEKRITRLMWLDGCVSFLVYIWGAANMWDCQLYVTRCHLFPSHALTTIL